MFLKTIVVLSIATLLSGCANLPVAVKPVLKAPPEALVKPCTIPPLNVGDDALVALAENRGALKVCSTKHKNYVQFERDRAKGLAK